MPASFITVVLSSCHEFCYHFVLLFINSQVIPPSLIFFPFSSSPFLTLSNSFIPPFSPRSPLLLSCSFSEACLAIWTSNGFTAYFSGKVVRSTLSQLSCASNSNCSEQLLIPDWRFSWRVAGLSQVSLVLCEDVPHSAGEHLNAPQSFGCMW